MLQDQATELRRMVDRGVARSGRAQAPRSAPVPLARTIAITSGKGGVGKSNIAVNLAAQLARMGRRVALLDADLGLANVDVLCGLSPAATLAHVVSGRRTLEQVLLQGPGGFTLIPGASGLTQMAGLAEHEKARLLSLVHRLHVEHDLLLIDTGAGIGPSVMTFLLDADELLVVTTPEPTAITDAYAVIKAATRQRPQLPIGLLVNMTRDEAEARAVYERVAAVCRRFIGRTVQDAGHLPHDPRVAQAVRRGRPFVMEAPDGPAGLCLRRLAHKIDRQAVEPCGDSFLRRMVARWERR